MQRLPDNVKLLTGTARPDRARPDSLAAALVPLDAVPEPPSWLVGEAALAEWHRLAPRLVACRVLTEAMTTSLGHYCMLHAGILAVYARGEEPRAALIAQLARIGSEFGLSPASAAKITPPKADGRVNPFAKFRGGA